MIIPDIYLYFFSPQARSWSPRLGLNSSRHTKNVKITTTLSLNFHLHITIFHLFNMLQPSGRRVKDILAGTGIVLAAISEEFSQFYSVTSKQISFLRYSYLVLCSRQEDHFLIDVGHSVGSKKATLSG